jgi:thiosulfate/3-mercaptopyruvate sulfurtransferase
MGACTSSFKLDVDVSPIVSDVVSVSYTTLISTDTLAARAGEGWVIVDCRFDLQNPQSGQAEYDRAHIPGAVYASLDTDLSGPRTGSNGRHPLPSDQEMAATFGRLGIGPDVQLVAYDQDSGMFASRLWWMVRYLGHDAVAVLDGGWAKWTREQRPTRSGIESRPAATFIPAPRREWRLTADDVAPLVGGRDVLLVDARSPERYEGRSEPLDRVAGHIPGAANHHYKDNLTADGTMRPVEELRENFARALGGHAPEQTVMYCGSGVTACQNLLAMAHAGLDGARLYPGSWSEWSADPSRPIETGIAKLGGG